MERTKDTILAESFPVLQGFSVLRDRGWQVAANGELNLSLLIDSVEPPVVVKLPRYCNASKYITFEAELVSSLRNPDSAPLIVPQLVDCRSTHPPHAIFTKVPGVTLPNETVRSFSDAEKHILGEKIGAFVAWLSTALSPEDYRYILKGTPEGMIPERTNNIRRYARLVSLHEGIDDTLDSVLIEAEEELCALQATGALESTIVGHDDLRIDNMTFAATRAGWRPAGIFDFGLTKLSNAERELRHIVALGDTAAKSAIASYETATQQHLDRRLLQFWAVGQAASAAASLARAGNMPGLLERVNDLAYLLPDRDWTRLQKLCA